MPKLLALVGIAVSLAACASSEPETAASAAEAQMTEAKDESRRSAPLLDCAQLGSFPEAAMKALAGTYERVGVAPANGLQSFSVGPLRDVPGWGGKTATYTRDMSAPCMDFADASMTSTRCAGQTGTVTAIFDNPAIGAALAFEDASGLPFGKDFYFVTSSRLEPDGRLSALCLANGGTGETFLFQRRGSAPAPRSRD